MRIIKGIAGQARNDEGCFGCFSVSPEVTPASVPQEAREPSPRFLFHKFIAQLSSSALKVIDNLFAICYNHV